MGEPVGPETEKMIRDLERELGAAKRMESLLQQFSQELGTALHLRGDGTLNLSEAVQEKFREKEAEIAASQTKLSNAINTEFREQSRLIGERDAAQARLVILEEADRVWDKTSLVQIVQDRDELKNRVEALTDVLKSIETTVGTRGVSDWFPINLRKEIMSALNPAKETA